MATSEKKYQKLFEEAQADAIRFRKERDAVFGTIRSIGRVSSEQIVIAMCKATIAGRPVPDDTKRIDALEKYVNEHGALVLHTGDADCGKHAGLGLRPGNVKRDLREALDKLVPAMEANS